MRVRVGQQKITPTIAPTAAATAATEALINKGTPAVTITATNATTKIYKGISQWEPPESVPTGIAQGVYQAIHAASAYQGSLTLSQEDIPVGRIIGKALNLSGGETAWATMAAPIHALSFDIDSGTTTIQFGPNPALAPQDFLELQRILRTLPVTWWSTEERESNKHGARDHPSALGDTVAPFDLPKTVFEPTAQTITPFVPRLTDGGTKTKVSAGFVVERIPGAAEPVRTEGPSNLTTAIAITAGQQVSVRVDVGTDGKMVSSSPVTITVGTENEASVHYYPISGNDRTGRTGYFLYKLAVLREGAGGAPDEFEMFLAGSHIDHFQSLTLLDNILENYTADFARPLKDFHPPTGKYRFRAIEKPEGAETTITETADTIEVRGNSRAKKVTYTIEGESPVQILEFKDGMEIMGVTSGTVPTVDIPIPALPAGWTGTIEIVDVCATFVHTITVVNGIITNYQQISL
jgi:hypothetical protein